MERASAGGDYLPQPGAVAVHSYVVLPRKPRDLSYLVQGRDQTVQRVLEADDARWAGMHVVPEHDLRFDVF
ncbi:hypothetical protein PC116_g33376 [Phytophthora cactorum]|nr:hypothetical protein PC116_g33376 [Phytophthora cactorum]